MLIIEDQLDLANTLLQSANFTNEIQYNVKKLNF